MLPFISATPEQNAANEFLAATFFGLPSIDINYIIFRFKQDRHKRSTTPRRDDERSIIKKALARSSIALIKKVWLAMTNRNPKPRSQAKADMVRDSKPTSGISLFI